LAVMSWFGIREKAKKDEEGRVRYQADLRATAAAMQSSHGQPPPPAGQPQSFPASPGDPAPPPPPPPPPSAQG
jgi:hypothetical protein